MRISGLLASVTGFVAALALHTAPASADIYGSNGTGVVDVAVNDVQSANVVAALEPLVAQSFTSETDGLLTQAVFYSDGMVTASDTVMVDLLAGDGLNGTLLGSGVQVIGPNDPDPATGGFPIVIDLRPLNVQVVAGLPYTLRLVPVPPFLQLSGLGLLGNDQNIYPGGQAYNVPGEPDTDFYFTTFVLAVSEPAALLLLAVGLTGIGIGSALRGRPGRRHRRRS